MSENALVRLKKSQTIPFIDTSATETHSWARIGRSTIFDLALNPTTTTQDYIQDEAPTDEVDSYKPTLSQELATVKGDPAFDFMYDLFYNLPTGQEAVKPVLLVFGGNACTTADPGKAWLVDATLLLNNLNTVDKKILFDISFGGSIKRGTVVVTDGAPVFTEAASGE